MAGAAPVEAPVGGGGSGARILTVLARAHVLFMLIGAVAVGAFLTTVPPGWGLDEQTHVYRTYQISTGTLFPAFDASEGAYLMPVPRPLYDLEQQGWGESNTIDRAKPTFQRGDLRDPDAYRRLGAARLQTDDPGSVDITQTVANVPVVYAAGAAGMALARVFGADVGTMLLAARIANAVMYLGLAFTAVWFARRLRLRWLIFVVALLPAAIFQASVITADTVTNGACLLFSSVVLTLLIERTRASGRALALLGAAAAAVALSKPTYALLIVLVAALPVTVFTSRAAGRRYKAAVLVGALVLSAGTVYLGTLGARAVQNQRPGIGSLVDPVAQLRFVLTHPLADVGVLGRTVEVFGQSWVQGTVGLFGYNTVPVPAPLVFLVVLTVALAAGYAERLRRTVGAAVLLAGCAVAAAVVSTFYLTFNPVGAPYIEGVQGRYFVPVVVVMAMGVAALLPVRVAVRTSAAPILFATSSSVALAGSLVAWYLTLH